MARWDAVRWTPEQDAEILRVYRAGEAGGNKRLAAKWGLYQGNVSRRAALLGAPPLICTAGGSPSTCRYSAREIAIVEQHCTEPVAQIRARLYKAGFSRSLVSIRGVLRRARANGTLGSRADALIDRDSLDCSILAAHMGVELWAVRRWIQRGMLPAKLRQGSKDHYVMRLADVRAFLKTYPQHWNHVLADKFFLVDVLTTPTPKAGRQRGDAA